MKKSLMNRTQPNSESQVVDSCGKICLEKADIYSLGMMFMMLMSLNEIHLETETQIKEHLKILKTKYPCLTNIVSQMVKSVPSMRPSWEQLITWTKKTSLEGYILNEVIPSSTNLAKNHIDIDNKWKDAQRKSANGFYKVAIRQLTEVFSEVDAPLKQDKIKLDIAKSFLNMGDLQRGALLLKEISFDPLCKIDGNEDFTINLLIEKLKIVILQMKNPKKLFDCISDRIKSDTKVRHKSTLLKLWCWWLVHVKLDFEKAEEKLKLLQSFPDAKEPIEFGSVHIDLKKLEMNLFCSKGQFSKVNADTSKMTRFRVTGHVFFRPFSLSVPLVQKINYYQHTGNLTLLTQVT